MRRSLLVGVVLALIAMIHLGAQSWYELYDDAIKDIGEGRYAAAEKKLLQARKAGPESGDRRLRYGSLREPFFPEFFLGIVYLETNRPKEALEQFTQARAASIEKVRNPRFQEIGTLIKRAQDRLVVVVADNSKPAPPVPPPVKPDPPPTPTSVPPKPVDPLEAIRQRFGSLMTDARTQLAQRNFLRADQIARSARTLAEQNNLGVQRTDADSLVSQIAGTAAAGLGDALQARDAPRARREYDALVAVLPAAAEPFRPRVETLERELATANTRERSLQLQRAAVVAFLGGRYTQTLTILGDAEKLTPLTARGYFYRACSLAASAITQAPTDAARAKQLESEARRSYQLAARTPNDFRQDLQWVSPKIRGLLGAK